MLTGYRLISMQIELSKSVPMLGKSQIALYEKSVFQKMYQVKIVESPPPLLITKLYAYELLNCQAILTILKQNNKSKRSDIFSA